MATVYNAAIIGAGQIAAGFDRPGDARVLTHAHALSANTRMRLAGFFDVDSERARAASAKWGGKAFGSMAELLGSRPELVVVCSPDATHASVLRSVLEVPPRAVLCEKPMSLSLTESRSLVAAFAERRVTLGVNYQRRYDPSVRALRDAFRSGSLGRALAGSVIYSKGILHNGSHAVDTLRFLFGQVTDAEATGAVHDYSAVDPTVSGRLRFGELEIAFLACNESLFSIFEIDLIFEKARYRFTHSGLELEIQVVAPDPVFPGYRELAPAPRAATGLSSALSGVVADLVGHLDSGSPLECTAADILETQVVCERLAGRR